MYILSDKEVLKTLEDHIDHSQIPSKYGGGHTYTFGDLPNLYPDVLEGWTWEDGHSTGLPIGPIRWEEGEEGEMVAVAVGSEEGKKRRVVVGKLKESRWRDVFFPDIRATDEKVKGEKTGTSGIGEDAPRQSTSSEVTAAIPTSAGPPVSA